MRSINRIKVSIIGGSGYVGGELLRILLSHPGVEVFQVVSSQNSGKPVCVVHPNMRGIKPLKFIHEDDLEPCDVLFLALPHGESSKRIEKFNSLSPRIIDLSADFRLNNAEQYRKWYKMEHPAPEFLERFVYGLAELHREELKKAKMIAVGGCNATAVILALYPLYKKGVVSSAGTVVEVKVGTSEGGSTPSRASHHPERSNSIRCYKPTGHRHIVEIRQELGIKEQEPFHITATAIDMVRGIHMVAHVFLKERMDEINIWKLYQEVYANEPFIRIVKTKRGLFRYSDPKLLWGTNFCDISFEIDRETNRLVVISAIDNLVKGAAGQAVQAFNLMMGFRESEGLNFFGLHPV